MNLKNDGLYWESVINLKTHSKLVGIFLSSNLNANFLGFYKIPLSFIASSLAIKEQEVKKSIEELARNSFCVFDPDSGFIWVINMLAIQAAEIKSANDNRLKNIKKQVKNLSSQPVPEFFHIFLDYYEELLGTDFISEVKSSVSAKSAILKRLDLNPSPKLEPAKNLTAEKPKSHAEKKELKDKEINDFFQKFWVIYPRKDSKADALKAMKALDPKKELQDLLINKVSIYERLSKGVEKNYIKLPGTWIRGKSWEDESLNQSNISNGSSCMPASSFTEESKSAYDEHQSMGGLDSFDSKPTEPKQEDGGLNKKIDLSVFQLNSGE